MALYLLNLDNLSSQSGGPTPGHLDGYVGSPINVPQGGQVLTTPATWTNPADNSTWAFVANGSGISGIKLIFDAHGNPSLSPVWTDHTGGTSPLVANGVLYYAASGTIYALDPLTGNILWSDSSIGGIHWQSPVVANGVLYIEDGSSNLTAYTLPFSPLTLTRGWNMLGIPSSSYTSASGLAAEI